MEHRDVVIRFVQLEGVRLSEQGPGPREGDYLATYDPNGMDGYGLAVWTDDPAKAMRLPDAGTAFRLWATQSTVRPLRADGRPNKPLTANSIEVVPAPERTT